MMDQEEKNTDQNQNGTDTVQEYGQMTLGKNSIISSGLVPGERIITAGMMKVQPGAVVREAPSADNQTWQAPVATK